MKNMLTLISILILTGCNQSEKQSPSASQPHFLLHEHDGKLLRLDIATGRTWVFMRDPFTWYPVQEPLDFSDKAIQPKGSTP